MINVEETKTKFWDMFIIDSLIGNIDRHNGKWGFIRNKGENKLVFSPIYDCGSCLNPILEDNEIEKINYITYLKEMKNKDSNKALKRIFNNINIKEINNFIDNIECISDIRKSFYKDIINIRYNTLKEVYGSLK